MKKNLETKSLVLIAMFGAIATLLMLFEFPLVFIAPQFYELDFSEVPVLIGTFALGPAAGVIIEFLKIVINLIINGTDTAYVGELANFLVGLIFILPAGIIYRHHRTKKGAYCGLAAGTLALTAGSCLVNGLILLPWYAGHFFAAAGGMEALVAFGSAIHPSIDSAWDFVLLCVAPFNLLKGILVSVVTALLYKRVSFLIKGHGRDGR